MEEKKQRPEVVREGPVDFLVISPYLNVREAVTTDDEAPPAGGRRCWLRPADRQPVEPETELEPQPEPPSAATSSCASVERDAAAHDDRRRKEAARRIEAVRLAQQFRLVGCSKFVRCGTQRTPAHKIFSESRVRAVA